MFIPGLTTRPIATFCYHHHHIKDSCSRCLSRFIPQPRDRWHAPKRPLSRHVCLQLIYVWMFQDGRWSNFLRLLPVLKLSG